MNQNQDKKKCCRCGKCCREVFLLVDKAYTEDGLDHLEWARYHGLKIVYREDANGKKLWGIELDAICKHLCEESEDKTSCSIYEHRPQMCRNYTGEKDFPNCGYQASQTSLD